MAAGMILMAAGCAGSIYTLLVWEQSAFGELDPFQVMRIAIPSVLSLALGLQVALASLFLSLLKVQFLETGTHRRTSVDRAREAEENWPHLPEHVLVDRRRPTRREELAADRAV
jgi:hypothetical protein